MDKSVYLKDGLVMQENVFYLVKKLIITPDLPSEGELAIINITSLKIIIIEKDKNSGH